MFGESIFGGMTHANYDQRVVDRYANEATLTVVSTALVTDSDHPFETAVAHKLYNDRDFVIVETYDDIEAAKIGHAKWVKVMTGDTLPEILTDVSTCQIVNLAKMIGAELQTEFKRAQ